jgi:hypothetical protein
LRLAGNERGRNADVTALINLAWLSGIRIDVARIARVEGGVRWAPAPALRLPRIF